jgi:hypothetical protein
MAKQHHKKAEDALLLALAYGAGVEAAAQKCKLSPRTVYRRMEEPAFRARLFALRADMVRRTAGTLTAAGTDSVRTLLELQKAPSPPAVRLAAARAILELGVKLRETAELEARIAALEQASEPGAPDPYGVG